MWELFSSFPIAAAVVAYVAVVLLAACFLWGRVFARVGPKYGYVPVCVSLVVFALGSFVLLAWSHGEFYLDRAWLAFWFATIFQALGIVPSLTRTPVSSAEPAKEG